MSINSDTKLKDIVVSNPGARRVLEDAKLDFCCGGGKSLQDACLHSNISPDEILSRLRENSQAVGADETNWLSAPLCDLTRHIRETHHRYVRQAVARDRALFEKVKAKHAANHPELSGLSDLFDALGTDITMHMQKEEQILFPYIDALEKSVQLNRKPEPPFFQTVRNPISAMMSEHDAAGDLVKQIRKVSKDYSVPADACASYTALYEDLQAFEADLHQHVHLENNILFPRAVEMEAAAF